MDYSVGRKIEVSMYFGVWIGAVIYSIYSVYQVTDKFFENYDDAYKDFDDGWSFLGRKIDVSDEEWKMWIPLLYKLSPWIVVQVFVSQTLKRIHHDSTILCAWYITISLTYLYASFGLQSTLCTLLLPCISCLLTSLRSKFVSWIVHCCTLALIYWAKISDVVFREVLGLDDEQFFVLTAAICWIQLRSISYSIDSIESYEHVDVKGFVEDLMKNVAYCLYLPTLFVGPIVLYGQFTVGLKKSYSKWTLGKWGKIVSDLARYTFWLYFTQFFMHYLYFNALRFHPDVVKQLRPWPFFGFGYCLGQYFLNKYVVVYGLTCTVCRAEDIEAPAQPKCIARIHLYSDMWKYFDRGLYKFLLRYIYIPCATKSIGGQFFASGMCFVFIYLWHGMHYYIFVWSLFNFFGLVAENLAASAGNYFYKRVLRDTLSLRNRQRFECVIASPLLAFSAVSNFYFFAGQEIGDMYIQRVFEESWKINLLLFFVIYCCCQTSTEIKHNEQKCLMLKSKEKVKIKTK